MEPVSQSVVTLATEPPPPFLWPWSFNFDEQIEGKHPWNQEESDEDLHATDDLQAGKQMNKFKSHKTGLLRTIGLVLAVTTFDWFESFSSHSHSHSLTHFHHCLRVFKQEKVFRFFFFLLLLCPSSRLVYFVFAWNHLQVQSWTEQLGWAIIIITIILINESLEQTAYGGSGKRA